MTLALEPVFETAYIDGAEFAAQQIGVPSGAEESGMLLALQAERGWFKEISQTSLERVQKAIDQGIADGSSSQTVADAINSILNDPKRSMVIARTEIARAMEAGSMAQALSAGIERKEWLVAPGACPICQANKAEGPIPIHKAFQGGAETAPQHPNCRCTVIWLPTT